MKTYTLATLRLLSDRHLRRLAAGPDRLCVDVSYANKSTKWCETESLHEHIQNEQFRRWREAQ
jgi:hypothetical protein